MSHKQLDIDWPFDVTAAEKLQEKPKAIPLPQEGMRLRHYGKLLEQLFEKLKTMPEGDERDTLAYYTASHGDGGLIIEGQAAYLAVESMAYTHAVGIDRITAVVDEGVPLLLDGDEMVAYRHAYFKLAVVVGHHRLTVTRCDRAVHIDVRLLHRYGSMLVIRHTAYAERTDVVKVHAVVHQRVVAYIAQLLDGIEAVDAESGHDGIGSSFAGERHALDDVIAVNVRLGFQRKG